MINCIVVRPTEKKIEVVDESTKQIIESVDIVDMNNIGNTIDELGKKYFANK